MTDALAPGTVLRRRYRIIAPVGQGGLGAVYLAEDLRLPGRQTAIKTILPDPMATAEARAAGQAQFRREASVLAQLDHPALPRVSDYFVESGIDCLVMDYVAGPDLRQVISEARASGEFLPEARIIDWAGQLLDALEYLHSREPPVIHRDIKPANVKLVTGDRLKLVDFGLVKHLDPADPRTLTASRGVGSLPYTPLEQYAGDTGHTDARSDLYALGATLYHLVTLRPPATAHERFLMPNALQRPSQLNPRLSPRLESVILTAMALHPERRPADAAALRQLLRGDAPLRADVELGTAAAAWRAALWDNAGLLALVALLLLLATLATWQAGSAAPAVVAPLEADSAPATMTIPPGSGAAAP